MSTNCFVLLQMQILIHNIQGYFDLRLEEGEMDGILILFFMDCKTFAKMYSSGLLHRGKITNVNIPATKIKPCQQHKCC